MWWKMRAVVVFIEICNETLNLFWGKIEYYLRKKYEFKQVWIDFAIENNHVYNNLSKSYVPYRISDKKPKYFGWSTLLIFARSNFDHVFVNGEKNLSKSAAIIIFICKAHLQIKLLKKIDKISVIYKWIASFWQFPQSDSDRASNPNGSWPYFKSSRKVLMEFSEAQKTYSTKFCWVCFKTWLCNGNVFILFCFSYFLCNI